MSKFLTNPFGVLGFILGVILLLILGTLIFQFLWNNAVVAALTVARPVTFFEALGLNILLNMKLSNRKDK